MKKEMVISLCLVLGIVVLITTGTTFAYYTASNSANNINGDLYEFEVSLSSQTIFQSTDIIPLKDNFVKTAISKSSNKCRDNNGYEVCSLYKLTLSNTGTPEILNTSIKTTSSSYTSSNLKARIYDSNYNPISDILTLGLNNTPKQYFKLNNGNMTVDIENVNKSYYLVIWLHDTERLQNEDQGKTYYGEIVFESLNGGQVSAEF